MAYVTVADLKAALQDAGGIGARTAAVLPDGRLQANIDEAAAEVTGRLTRSYTLPDPGADPLVVPDGIPALLRTIILGIAAYLATLEFNGSQALEERDPIQLRYTRALDLLKQVAKGDLVVPGVDPNAGESPSGEPEIYQGHARLGVADSFYPDDYAGRHNMPAHLGGGLVWE